jgi:hypothetical protein
VVLVATVDQASSLPAVSPPTALSSLPARGAQLLRVGHVLQLLELAHAAPSPI